MNRDQRDPSFLGAAILFEHQRSPELKITEVADRVEAQRDIPNYGETRDEYVNRRDAEQGYSRNGSSELAA